MHHFSIRDVENLSGIKAHTLRIWEQRYGLCICKRKESLHRYYDNEDLKHILRISYLYHNGFKISRIAGMEQEEIIQEASKKIGENSYDLQVNKLLESCMDFDQEKFEHTLNNTLVMMGLEKCMLKVVYPFMEKIGLLWMTDHVLPALEHFCSHIIQNKIIASIDRLHTPQKFPQYRFLVFAPEGEEHELPLLLAQYLLKKQGIKTVFFGRNVSIEQLEYYCKHHPVSHLYFHLITNFTNCEISSYLTKLSKQFRKKKIIAAGPLLTQVTERLPANVEILSSLKEMPGYLQHLTGDL